MRNVFSFVALLVVACTATPEAKAQTTISFPTEAGGVVSADVYGSGERALLLVHGGRFTKESWARQAPIFVGAGFQVMAIDMRGFGQSHGPGDSDLMSPLHYLDVLAAVRYLRAHG